MDSEKKPKWEDNVAIEKGNQSILLEEKYASIMADRLQEDEMAQHKANVKELAIRCAGQHETLTDQMSKTLGKESAIDVLHNKVINIRNVVKSNKPTAEVAKVFGVGDSIWNTMASITAAANTVMTAYNANTVWSNKAGIISADIAKVKALLASLDESAAIQEDSKFTRKAKTMDKNLLHRVVEDEVTRISSIGCLAFDETDPSIATLFTDLIPSSGSKPAVKAADPPKA